MDTVEGDECSMKTKVLETGASLTQVCMKLPYCIGLWSMQKFWHESIQCYQDLGPVKNICAHLNAFHVYADDPKRFVETNHYCSHLTEGK